MTLWQVIPFRWKVRIALIAIVLLGFGGYYGYSCTTQKIHGGEHEKSEHLDYPEPSDYDGLIVQ